ncbi:MAG: hypothetical protein E7172_02350 [Firmicutes bacterium]|nr:hypothetical protein [Bacillota bacterium]
MNNIDKLRKYFKNNQNICEINIIDYDEYNLYIRIDYFKKNSLYKLIWVDLNAEVDNILEMINYTVLPLNVIESLENAFLNDDIYIHDYHYIYEDAKVLMDVYLDKFKYHVYFNRYIPKQLQFLEKFFVLLFFNLPKRFENIVYKFMGVLSEEVPSYEYEIRKEFDLFNGSLKEIFLDEDIEKGQKDFLKNKVLYLEKIGQFYISVIDDNVVMIELFNDSYLKLGCSCSKENYCSHIVSTFLAIRNNFEKHFYKLVPYNDTISVIDRVKNLDFILCLGIEGSKLKIINHRHIEYAPLFKDKEILWKIIEDDNNHSLEKEIDGLFSKLD